MECASTTTATLFKAPSNISESVSKFAKGVCRLRSIGVFYSDNSNTSMSEDGSDYHSEEIECGDCVKIHPQPIEDPCESSSSVCGEAEILKLFDIVSSLKLAYVQLQEAHIPYDPEKIKAADELVVAELEVLCKIKRVYKEKQLTRVNLLNAKIEVTERMLEKLKSQIKAKESEIFHLQQVVKDLHLGNTSLVEKAKNVRVGDVNMFGDCFREAAKSIHDFAKPLICLMKASGWDLDLAANSIENGVVYSKRCHKKYAFEAYIARRMFHGMSLESYNVDDIMSSDNLFNYLVEKPNSDFAKFCRKKYLLVVHPTMEASFFGSLEQRIFVLSGKNPRTQFYQIFVKMAKWIWILQGTASSIHPSAKIFVVNRGCKFSDAHMESVESCEGLATCKVEFMVMPGFRLGETLLPSRVYLSR